jgi:hypothetical protein
LDHASFTTEVKKLGDESRQNKEKMGNFRKSVYELLMISMGLLIGLFPLSHRVFEFPSPVILPTELKT